MYVEQVEQSQLMASRNELRVKCEQQRTQPDMTDDDQLLLTARGDLSLSHTRAR